MKSLNFLLIPMLSLVFAQSPMITLTNPKPLWLAEPLGGNVSDANWSVDGQQFVTAGDDGTARVWDTATGKAVLRIDGD
jgi:WD40 repeat protein